MSNYANVLHEATAQVWHGDNMVSISCKRERKKKKHAAYIQAREYSSQSSNLPSTVTAVISPVCKCQSQIDVFSITFLCPLPLLGFHSGLFCESWIAVCVVEGDKSIMGHPQAAHTGRRLEKATCFCPCEGWVRCSCCFTHLFYGKTLWCCSGWDYSTSCEKVVILNVVEQRDIQGHLCFSQHRPNPTRLSGRINLHSFQLIILQACNETLCNDFNSFACILDSYSSVAMRKFKKLVFLLHLIFWETALSLLIGSEWLSEDTWPKYITNAAQNRPQTFSTVFRLESAVRIKH